MDMSSLLHMNDRLYIFYLNISQRMYACWMMICYNRINLSLLLKVSLKLTRYFISVGKWSTSEPLLSEKKIQSPSVWALQGEFYSGIALLRLRPMKT